MVDNPFEIEKFRKYAGKVRLLIRIKTDSSKAVVDLSYKFGCLPQDVIPLAEKIKSYGLDYYGLAFHVGSQCPDNGVYLEAINISRELINELSTKGFTTSLLDIGGGFPVPYTEEVPSIEDFCKPIRKALDDNIDPQLTIACEPGRFISATARQIKARFSKR